MRGFGILPGVIQLPFAPPPAPAQIIPLGQSAYDAHGCGRVDGEFLMADGS
jgi:hypothetical protein